MALIDGKNYGSSSVTKSLARKRLADQKEGKNAVQNIVGEPGEKMAGAGQEEHGGDGDVKHLHAIHGEHAEGAEKSAHIYQHEDGTHHLHVHDHKTGEHEHTEHGSHHEALAKAKEHLGGGEADESGKLDEEGGDALASLGVSGDLNEEA